MFLHELGLDILFGLLDKVVVVNLGDISLTWDYKWNIQIDKSTYKFELWINQPLVKISKSTNIGSAKIPLL